MIVRIDQSGIETDLAAGDAGNRSGQIAIDGVILGGGFVDGFFAVSDSDIPTGEDVEATNVFELG